MVHLPGPPRASLRPALVFDLGGVLIDWRPHAFVESLAPGVALSGSERDWLMQCVFQDYGPSSDWVAFDLNRLELDELCARIAKRLSGSRRIHPRLDCLTTLATGVEEWIHALTDRLQPLSPNVAWLRALRMERWQLYFLSNMPRLFIPKVLRHRELFDCFDAGIFSGEVNLAKPDPALFALAACRFSATTESAANRFIFLDDHPANVAAARSFGWRAILFDSLSSAQTQFARLVSQSDA
ncbi:MAG: HAD-IA family hydrolase [Betaproteobacteria bacterium]|nr:HAD-IA family hydrolase [Betaproteobacteria bacterium]